MEPVLELTIDIEQAVTDATSYHSVKKYENTLSQEGKMT